MKSKITYPSIAAVQAHHNPTIFVSPALRRKITIDDIRHGLENHRMLDSLPSAFVAMTGRTVMTVTRADYSAAMLIQPHEFDHYSQRAALRLLNKESALA